MGIRRVLDGIFYLYINGEDMGVVVFNIFKNVFMVIDFYGLVEMIIIISSCFWDVFLMVS